MIDNQKIGNQITQLRREKGLTGEQFAELLCVSPQAVSKWENGKNLPETALLPKLAETLGVSIDSILIPQQLFILRAVFTNGVDSTDITSVLSRYVNGGKLDIAVTAQFIGAAFSNERVAVLTVKYQTPNGTYYAFAPQGERLMIDAEREGLSAKTDFAIIGAWYGNADGFRDVMFKMEHYDYFRYKDLRVNHETFPSSPATDAPEFLTLVYLNQNGIHAVSCRENEVLTYSADRTELTLKDTSVCILPGVMKLSWGNGMDCCWGGSLYAALKYMGEPYTYEQIMGMSGACYRINFTEVWDWSATDTLVAFDYSDPLFRAVGYEQVLADRLDKDDRSAERKLIVSDIQMGKPVIAINLRTAAEWGIITGYADNGKILYCRTYFDGDLLDDSGKVKDTGNEYLETEFWPFMLVHFGMKTERPTDNEILRVSLKTLADSFCAPCERGYWQGEEAYQKWIAGLKKDSLWDLDNARDDFYRRASVNQYTLRSLIDERRCASVYLNECGQTELAGMYRTISENVGAFYHKWLDKWDKVPNGGAEWRTEEAAFLEAVLEMERRCVELARVFLKSESQLLSPRITKHDEMVVVGLSGDGSRTGEVWDSFDALYKQKPFKKVCDAGWEIRFYDGDKPSVKGADIHVGFESSVMNTADYIMINLPESEYVVFDVPVASGYESRNSVMDMWLRDNAHTYSQRMLNGLYCAVERYDEKYNGEEPDSIVEIWIPLVKK